MGEVTFLILLHGSHHPLSQRHDFDGGGTFLIPKGTAAFFPSRPILKTRL